MFTERASMAFLLLMLFGLVSMGISGCASSPPNLYPSLRLLDENKHTSGELLSHSVAMNIDQATYGSKFLSDELSVTVLEDFTSAMGRSCKRVLISDAVDRFVEKTVVCLLGSDWYLYPSLL